MTKTALVTGISGFTGPYVAAELLARGYEVHGLEREESTLSNVQSHQVDLRDLDGLKALVNEIQPDAVVHLAAIAFVGHLDFTDMYLSNVLGTRNLLSAVSECGSSIERVLLASSANIYGNTNTTIICEDTPYNPQNDYAVSKCAMEMMARLWTDRVPITVARPFNYTGVGQSLSFLIPKIVDHFANAKTIIELGNTDVYRDFSDVRTVAEAYARLLTDGQVGETYNICSNLEYSIDFVINELNRHAGYEIEVRVNPDFVRSGEIEHLRGSNARLIDAVGEFTPIPFEDTLTWMYQRACDHA